MIERPTSALGPTLETKRLFLRPPTHDDFPRWADFMSDPETTRFIGGVQSKHEVWRAMASVAGMWALQGEAMFSVIEKDTGQWVGRVGPWQPEGWPGTEVGWSIVRDRWGRGYAPEAAAACTDWAFDTLGWSEVIHTIAPGNASSKAVAAKLGSRFIGMGRLPEPSHEKPVEICGQTRAEWRARKEQSA